MKQITLLLIFLLFTALSYSQQPFALKKDFVIKGVRYSDDLMIVQPGVWYEVECSVIHGDYCMRINDNFKLISGGSTPFIAFKAFYYFGGQSVAPQTMNIDIEKL